MAYKDKVKQKEAQKRHYEENKELYIQRKKELRQKTLDWFRNEYVPSQSCSKCGENHPAVLDFHHLDPTQKDGEVAKMVWHGKGKSTILKEIAKCIVLCSNCHRKLHYEERIALADGR